MSQKKPKKILLAGHGTGPLAAAAVHSVMKTMSMPIVETRTGRMSGKATKKAPHPQNLTKSDQEELAPICRQRFENRKKNPTRFNKKKKF